MLTTLRQLLDHAAENSYGIPAFNVNNLEQAQAILEAANEVNSPVIMQISSGARKYAGNTIISALIKGCLQEYSHIPVAVHQDHGQSANICMKAIQIGCSSVMIDGSLLEDGKTIASYEYNVHTTRLVTKIAHSLGVSVEGELGCLGSLETGDAGEEDGIGATKKLSRSEMLTDPDQAKDFVDQTKIDALAIAIGTSHGAYKFSKEPTDTILDMPRVLSIHNKIPNTHLVMHGSSSVEQETLRLLREHGLEIKPTFGVPVINIVEAIKHGVRKINIDTDIRLTMTAAILVYLKQNKAEFDPRKYLLAAKNAAKELCIRRYIAFGSAEQASKISTIGLESMSKYYT